MIIVKIFCRPSRILMVVLVEVVVVVRCSGDILVSLVPREFAPNMPGTKQSINRLLKNYTKEF